MDRQADQRIERELDRGEQLLWFGQPSLGVKLHLPDLVLLPMGLLLTSFGIVIHPVALRNGWEPDNILGSLPLVLVGVYLLGGRWLWDAKRRARTVYAVTDRRIILVSGIFRTRVRSIDLRTLGDLSFIERRNGKGDFLLGSDAWGLSCLIGTGLPLVTSLAPPLLESVDQARHVYEIIRDAQHREW